MSGWSGISVINSMSMADAALMYARAGIKIFPVYGIIVSGSEHICECQNGTNCDNAGKHPRIKGWSTEATTDEDQVREWWSRWPRANIGIPTGSVSGLVAVDLDVREMPRADSALGVVVDGSDELEQWMERELGIDSIAELHTLAQKTGGGGRQLLFTDPGGIKNSTSWLPGVDIRGEGGLIVAPPSVHRSGIRYEWQSEEQPAEMPERLASTLRLSRSARRVHSTAVTASGAQVQVSGGVSYDYAQAKISGPPLGARDDFFNSYAFELKKSGKTEAQAKEEIERVWRLTPQKPGDPLALDTAIDKVRRVYADESITPEQQDPITSELMAWAKAAASGDDPYEMTPDEQATVDGIPADSTDDVPTHTITTDLGNADRAASLWADRARHVEGFGWYIWDGNRFALDRTNLIIDMTKEVIQDIRRDARKIHNTDAKKKLAAWARNTESSSKITSMIQLAKSDRRLALSSDDLDKNPMLFVAKNGTVDLEKGIVRESSPEDLCTQIGDVYFDGKATCPRWEDHVQYVCQTPQGERDEQMESFLQRWAGYTLTGLVTEQKFAFCFGGGKNGKNVFIETLFKIMGGYAIAGSQQMLTGENQHETIIADLAGSRLVFIDETPKSRINESRLKQLTGSARIRARKIRQDSFEFDAKFKIWISSNHKPRITDTTEGMWRRLDLIPFDSFIPPEKRILGYVNILHREEGPGILNWALRGLKDYLDKGTLGTHPRVDGAVSSYRDDEDLMGQHIRETYNIAAFKEGHKEWVPNFAIHQIYAQWCKDIGIDHVPTMRSLGDDLLRFGFEKDSNPRRITVYPGGSKVQRGWWCPPLLDRTVARNLYSW